MADLDVSWKGFIIQIFQKKPILGSDHGYMVLDKGYLPGKIFIF